MPFSSSTSQAKTRRSSVVTIDLVEKVAFFLHTTLILWHTGGGTGWAASWTTP